MKKIRRWRSGMDTVQAAQYLNDMAADGWVLEDAGYQLYTFRETEPQELTYRVVTLEEPMTGEELAQYEADGWQKVCNCDWEYFFVRERDLWTDEAVEKQLMVEELDRRIEKGKSDNKIGMILFAVLVCIFILAYRMRVQSGVSTQDFLMNAVVELAPNFFFLFLGGWLMTRRLRKKKERMLDGESVSARDTDWRGQRVRSAVVLAVGFSLIGWGLYLEMGWNEKIYGLPQEIDYAEVPAVRLENLEDGELIRIGENVEIQKEEMKDIYGNAFLQWHTYKNAVTDHGFLLIMKETETNQQMSPVGGAEKIELTTDHCMFLLEVLAEKQYKEEVEWEEELYGDHLKWDRELLENQKDIFDELHVCRRDFGEEGDIHILCRQGKQVMELDYTGQAEPERILKEIEKVFEAQN